MLAVIVRYVMIVEEEKLVQQKDSKNLVAENL
jgi:hypothetical protein